MILKSTTAAIAAIFCFLGFVYGKFSNCYFYSVWMKRHLIWIHAGQWKLSVYALYTCVWLRLKDLHTNELAALRQHLAVLARYRYATREELEEHDDVCAVCLSEFQNFARITPCQHVFHGDCLRRCLQTSDLCPICKRQLKFEWTPADPSALWILILCWHFQIILCALHCSSFHLKSLIRFKHTRDSTQWQVHSQLLSINTLHKFSLFCTCIYNARHWKLVMKYIVNNYTYDFSSHPFRWNIDKIPIRSFIIWHRRCCSGTRCLVRQKSRINLQ